jgi:hypothetical protein
MNSQTETIPSTPVNHPVAKKPSRIIGAFRSIGSKGKNLFSISALLVVIVWMTCEINGWKPNDTADKILAGCILILAFFEVAKTTVSHQNSKQAFLFDLITGNIELVLLSVTITILFIEGRLDYGQLVNWAMVFFVLCDSSFVLFNRFSMNARQITSVSDNPIFDHNRHDGHDS